MTSDPVCGGRVDERRAAAASIYQGRIYYFCSPEHRAVFEENPGSYAHSVQAMALKVGVMGSASGYISPRVRRAAFALGTAIAKRGLTLITGASPGLPYESARGARASGGISVGISPALSLDQHLGLYRSPADAFDVIIYTGSGLMGREIVNIRSSDVVVIIAGHSGTLGEFAIAYDEGKLIGVVRGSGGIADAIPELMVAIRKETGATVVYDEDPERLIDRLVETYANVHFRRPSVFAGGSDHEEPAAQLAAQASPSEAESSPLLSAAAGVRLSEQQDEESRGRPEERVDVSA